ncbi:hypothetical protein LIER_43309 [Lithospermum erythrorhizon]|uniref:Reverse transcriptase n=1 Tax=Lithospermum erythrorhizon TaxID=34254 RepID=A0AAV3PV32_LITER
MQNKHSLKIAKIQHLHNLEIEEEFLRQKSESAVKYFTNAFSEEMDNEYAEPLVDCIPHLVTAQQNKDLMAIPSLQEVKDVVFGMDKNSAAGPDDFNVTFFQHFWGIIAQDIHNAICSFFK